MEFPFFSIAHYYKFGISQIAFLHWSSQFIFYDDLVKLFFQLQLFDIDAWIDEAKPFVCLPILFYCVSTVGTEILMSREPRVIQVEQG